MKGDGWNKLREQNLEAEPKHLSFLQAPSDNIWVTKQQYSVVSNSSYCLGASNIMSFKMIVYNQQKQKTRKVIGAKTTQNKPVGAS